MNCRCRICSAQQNLAAALPASVQAERALRTSRHDILSTAWAGGEGCLPGGPSPAEALLPGYIPSSSRPGRALWNFPRSCGENESESDWQSR